MLTNFYTKNPSINTWNVSIPKHLPKTENKDTKHVTRKGTNRPEGLNTKESPERTNKQKKETKKWTVRQYDEAPDTTVRRHEGAPAIQTDMVRVHEDSRVWVQLNELNKVLTWASGRVQGEQKFCVKSWDSLKNFR